MTVTSDKIDKKTNLLGLSQDDLEQFLVERGEKPFRAKQVLQWIHQRGVDNFDDMTDLSKALRARLKEDAEISPPKVEERHDSTDGTIKWLFTSGVGQAVETVFIPETDRGTLCISSQVGCALDCSFCATGAQGFNRNLTSAEIIGQVRHAIQDLSARDNGESAITNVVFMGMGEPLANYRNVVPVLKLLVSDLSYGLSRRRVTLSTSGIVPHINKLADDCNVALAVSLHAPNDELRSQIVPINKIHPIAELLESCWQYAMKRSNRFITFEYVMLRDVNDTIKHANQLAALLKNRPAKVNLIPFNPFPGTEFKRSSAESIRRRDASFHEETTYRYRHNEFIGFHADAILMFFCPSRVLMRSFTFPASWPQAASMSSPRVLRVVATTPLCRNRFWK